MTFSAAPMEAYAWAEPNIDLEDPRFVISVEWVWPEGDWTHFSLVRSSRSPARRREEGQVVMECFAREWSHVSSISGRPVYRDPQPPPGEWVYYTAFVLDGNRVWKPAGYINEIGVADHDWTLRLPELLPGVAISEAQRTISPAQHGNDLVQFFQSPGAFLDRAVTMAEATQFFWDPLRCPPQMLEHLLRSIGYEYDVTLGIGRVRHVIDALMKPQQGSLRFIDGFVEGASGCRVGVEISNNLMIDTDDSSFESGDLTNSRWAPQTNMELRHYEDWLDPTPVVPPNVLIAWFLHMDAADTITCGDDDPIQHGIPCGSWTEVRMGCYAHDEFDTENDVTLTMGVKVYSVEGLHLTDLEVLPAQTLTSNWAPYFSPDTSWTNQEIIDWMTARGDDTTGYDQLSKTELLGLAKVVMPEKTTRLEHLPSDALTEPARWTAAGSGYASPQTTTPVSVDDGLEIDWNSGPTTDPTNGALWGIGNVEMENAVVGKWYRVSMTVRADLGAVRWRPAVGWEASGDWKTPDGGAQTTSFLWKAARTDPFVGIEVDPEDDDWVNAGPHVITAFTFTRLNTEPAYAVPYITVSDACSIDLIVVDDG